MKAFLLLQFCLAFATAFTQQIFPGGVHGPIGWYITDGSQTKPSFKNIADTSNKILPLLNAPANTALLNQYPALVFTAQSSLPVSLTNAALTSATYFTVYKPVNVSSENIIWHFSKNSNTQLVLTTNRMADLEDYRYINYTDIVPLNPKVNTYVQQKQKDSIAPASQLLNIGAVPGSPRLPVVSFTGLIPEIIIYNRALDWQEQIRVASYLALKYGITLTEPRASYLDSEGQKIWDGESYTKYHNNIAGIGRDDSSGLFQRSASSSNTPGLLSISTHDSFANRNFLLWGDNDLPLVADEKLAGVPLLLQRKWLVVTNSIADSIHSEITIDTKEMDIETPAKAVYWMAIDRTGEENFSLTGTEFIRMSKPLVDGKANFKTVFNKAGGKQVIGFTVAQELLLSTSITDPTCVDPFSGTMQVRVWGGRPPYQLKILHKASAAREVVIAGNAPVTLDNIAAGNYVLIVSDQDGNIYKDELYVNNSDAPVPVAIAKKYVLNEGQLLQLNADDNMASGLNYSWTGPIGFESSGAHVTLSQAGAYTLTVSSNGCAYVHQFAIVRPPKNAFRSVLVYPNPSQGLFTVKLSIDKPSPVTMNVYTEDGRLIATKSLKGFANYSFTEQLEQNGLYYLVFRSGLSQATEKIIVGR